MDGQCVEFNAEASAMRIVIEEGRQVEIEEDTKVTRGGGAHDVIHILRNSGSVIRSFDPILSASHEILCIASGCDLQQFHQCPPSIL